MYLVCAEKMRQMDMATIQSFGIPGRVLMENAGRGATQWLLERFPDALSMRIAVMAGRGNNGGDGFVMGRYLAGKGADVTVYLLANEDRVSGDAAANLALLHSVGVPVVSVPDEESFAKNKVSISHRQLIIDAILGTGLRSDVKGLYEKAIRFINSLGRPVFSVDIPSGVDSDTGQPRGVCVKAAATATFGFAKVGHVLFPGASFTGDLRIIDIGIPDFIANEVAPKSRLLTQSMVSGYIRPRQPDMHKGRAGHLLVVGCSQGKTGAGVMASVAAMRTGAGLVTLAVPAGVNGSVESMAPEVMTLPAGKPGSTRFDETAEEHVLANLEGKKAVAIGPGMGTGPAAGKLLRTVIENSRIPVIIDADGLNCLARDHELASRLNDRIVLTPHPGEMSRLCKMAVDRIQADRAGCAKNFATEHKAHLVLKGAGTVVAHPDGSVFINRTGNPGMASGGMGDVLTGVIAGLVCQGYPCDIACRLGVFLHGRAADIVGMKKGEVGILASEVAAALPEAISTLSGNNHDGDACRFRDPYEVCL